MQVSRGLRPQVPKLTSSMQMQRIERRRGLQGGKVINLDKMFLRQRAMKTLLQIWELRWHMTSYGGINAKGKIRGDASSLVPPREDLVLLVLMCEHLIHNCGWDGKLQRLDGLTRWVIASEAK